MDKYMKNLFDTLQDSKILSDAAIRKQNITVEFLKARSEYRFNKVILNRS